MYNLGELIGGCHAEYRIRQGNGKLFSRNFGKEKTTSDELIKRLVKDRWLSLQPRQTIVERLGGHPEHLLEDAPPDLSERATRKKAIKLIWRKDILNIIRNDLSSRNYCR